MWPELTRTGTNRNELIGIHNDAIRIDTINSDAVRTNWDPERLCKMQNDAVRTGTNLGWIWYKLMVKSCLFHYLIIVLGSEHQLWRYSLLLRDCSLWMVFWWFNNNMLLTTKPLPNCSMDDVRFVSMIHDQDDPWAILWQRLPAPWSSWGAELSFASWPGFPSVRISPPGQWGPGYHLHWRNRVGVEYLYGRVGSWPWSCHVQKNPHDPFLLAWSNKKSMQKCDNAREVVSMSVCQSRDARCRL